MPSEGVDMLVKFCDICGKPNPESKYHQQWKHNLPICENNVFTYWRDKDVCEECGRVIGEFIYKLVQKKRQPHGG
jgi:hypothetical protein